MERLMRPKKRNVPCGLPSGLFGGFLVLAAGVAATVLPNLTRAAPKVGDMVVFSGAPDPADNDATRFVVRRPGLSGCVLDLDAIRQTGGSLVVEARMTHPAPAFRLHWAGLRTSVASDDCGNNADMIIGEADLISIALAARSTSQRESMIAVASAD
jgi:hypothetical protein